jgi:predicted enzyme related to lactoylglutathione lyase
MANVIHWFEIPARNFDRACAFYSQLLEGDVHKVEHPNGLTYGFLPGLSQDGVGGAIVVGKGYEPSRKGSLIYFNGGKDLNVPLSRVEKSGGKILTSKTSIGENGFMAQFIDTEGNRIALHSMS